MLTSKRWWYAAGVRALKTFAQTLAATIPATAIITPSVDWMTAGYQAAAMLGTAALAAVLSLLTSIAGLPEIDPSDLP